MSVAAVAGPLSPVPPVSPVGECPKLAESCSFHAFDNGGGREEYVLCVDGRQFRISALARRILERLDGKTSLPEVAAGLRRESVPVTAEQLRELLEQRYAGLGVLESGNPAIPGAPEAPPATRTGFPLLLTWDLIPRRVVGWFAGGLRFLYSGPAALALLAVVALAHRPVYAQRLEGTSTLEHYLWIIGLCIFSILIHELGHAAAVSRFGGTPGNIGFGLYLLMPTFYADVSQVWRFPRRHRMLVDLGGVYFQQICFAVFALLGLKSGYTEFLVACRMIDLMTLMTLNPIFRFDGYWFLVDYLALPRLHSLALRYPGYLLRRLAGRPVERLDLSMLSRPGRLVFRLYSAVSSLFLIAIFWFAYRSLSITLTRFPVVIPGAFHGVVAAFEQRDVLLSIQRILALFLLLAFPGSALIGIALYLRGIGLWCAGKLRGANARRTAQETPRRREI